MLTVQKCSHVPLSVSCQTLALTGEGQAPSVTTWRLHEVITYEIPNAI